MKYFIERYNKSDSIAIFSSYPEKGKKYSQKVCALGGFTKNIAEALQQNSIQHNTKNQLIVITMAIKKPEIYEENGILVCRLLKKNNPLSFISIFILLLKLNRVNNILFEFEFGSFGRLTNTTFFPILLFFLKTISKKQFLVMHQVVNNLDEITGHLGWKRKDWKLPLFNFLLKIYYKILIWNVDKVIVLEKVFKKRLKTITNNSNKIIVIPHGVDTHLPILNMKKSRSKLNLPGKKKIILYFGYLTWYKGADLFLDYARKIESDNYLFILAGGESFTNSKKSHYKKYFNKFNKIPKNMIVTGFVPQNKMSLYFAAADLVVLPYRTMMSSSGPLSLAFSFERPVLLSKNLMPYLKSSDFKEALDSAKLKINDLFFNLDQKDFLSKIENPKINKLTNFSRFMKIERDYMHIAEKYLVLLKDSFDYSNRRILQSLIVSK